jgi:tetratricopeptide (TPR) repeat protein
MRKTLLFVGLVAAVGFLAYSNSFHVPFQFDDSYNISANPVLQRLGNFISSTKGYSYNPRRFIGYLTFSLNYHFGGLDVVGYHVVNLLIHVITALLVYFFVILTFRTPYFQKAGIGDQGLGIGEEGASQIPPPQPPTPVLIALFSALLFVSHPLQTEAVTYIVQRFASLTAMFYLLSVVMYIKARLAIDNRRGARGKGQEEKKEHDNKTFATEHTEVTETKPASREAGKLGSWEATGSTETKLASLQAGKPASWEDTDVTEEEKRSAISCQQSAKESNGQEAVTDSRFTIPDSRTLLPLAYFLLSFLSAVCAMMTKENSFTLPFVILLYEFMFFKASLRRKLAFLVPLLLTIIIIPVSIIGVHKPLGEIISDLSEKTRLQTNIPRWDYLMTQMRVITTYIRLLFFPVNQNLDYDYPISHSLFEPPVLLSFLFLTAIFGTAVYLLYKSRQEAMGVGQEGKKAHDKKTLATEGTETKLASLQAGKPASWEDTEDTEKTGQEASTPSPIAYSPSPASLSVPIAYSLSPIAPYYRLIAFGIFWFFITLSVESSFIPIVDVIFEHRMYLPSIGAFIAITTAVFVILRKVAGNREAGMEIRGQGSAISNSRFTAHDSRFTVVIVFFSLIIVLLSALTLSRNAVWQDGISLWKDVQAKSPRNARAYNNLGYIYLERGQTDQALEYFLTAVSFRPDYADARDNVGVAYYEKGMFAAAVGQFRNALALQPGSADIHHNLGLAYVQMGLKDDALAEFEAAIKIAPDNYEIYNDMGVVYREKGLTDMAIGSFRKAISLKPDYAGAHYNIGLAYQAMGAGGKAMEHLQKAHSLDPQRF